MRRAGRQFRQQASMRPRHKAAENMVPVRIVPELFGASMRPRHKAAENTAS